jgi:phosphoserine aminotransferase
MEKWAQKKAQLIYFEIDQGFYVGRAEKKDRSRHNFVFNLPTPKQDLHFIEEAAKQNILEIKGYKTVGGIRASLYNGTSVDSAQVLSHFMSYYRKKFG